MEKSPYLFPVFQGPGLLMPTFLLPFKKKKESERDSGISGMHQGLVFPSLLRSLREGYNLLLVFGMLLWCSFP
jgi:hypothetical protein